MTEYISLIYFIFILLYFYFILFLNIYLTREYNVKLQDDQ
jgi:hypothetical protein